MLSTNSTTFDTSSTPTSVDNLSKIVMFLFLSTRGILGVHACPGNLCFQWFFIFTASHLDIFTWDFNWLNVVTSWSQILFRVFVGLTSALLCPTRFSAAEYCSRYCFSVDFISLLNSKLKMLSSMLTGMSCVLPHQLTHRSKCVLVSWPFFLCAGFRKPPSDRKQKS